MDYKTRFWNDLKTGRFTSMVKESSKGQTLSCSREAYHVLKPLFAKEDDVEKVYLIFLDRQNKVLGIENLFTGTIMASHIYTREIAKRLIQLKASVFILGHNHPSGNIEPSAEDRSITTKVYITAASIDVHLHDHIIVGDGYYSMADSGWLKNVTKQFANLLKSDPTMEVGGEKMNQRT